MSCGQYSLAELTDKELQKIKEAEKSLNNLTGASPRERTEEQQIVLVAFRHDHK